VGVKGGPTSTQLGFIVVDQTREVVWPIRIDVRITLGYGPVVVSVDTVKTESSRILIQISVDDVRQQLDDAVCWQCDGGQEPRVA